jgi:autotransporter passenger strand-loop-strand repeat protein
MPVTVFGGQTHDVEDTTETGDLVQSGGTLDVTSSGSIFSTTVDVGGVDNIFSGGSATDTSLAGGIENVFAGAGATAATVFSGGVEAIFGVAEDTTVLLNGLDAVYGGGSALGTTVSSGGIEYVDSRGYASGAIVDGGIQAIEPGGSADATLVESGHLLVSAGPAGPALAWYTTIDGGDELLAGFNASGYSATINSGGTEVLDGGSSTDDTINGGVQVVFSQSEAAYHRFFVIYEGTVGATIEGGGIQVLWGGAAEFDTVDSGSFVDVISYGLTANDVINAGGTEYVLLSGTALWETIYGTQVVSSGGFAGSSIIEPGGVLVVDSGGYAEEPDVDSGGLLFVESGGTATYAIVSAGGRDYLYGGATSETIISGAEYVEAGGSAIGATVYAGGLQFVDSGGFAASTYVLDGGRMEIASAAIVGNAPIYFYGGGGTLQLDDSQHFLGRISGFDRYVASSSALEPTNYLDLRDIRYGPSTSASFVEANGGFSGTLTVTDGTHTANLVLLGNYATGDFQTANDGFGGTEIYDPANSAQLGSLAAAGHT